MSEEQVREIEIGYFKAAREIWLEQFFALSRLTNQLRDAPPLQTNWSDLGELNAVATQINKFGAAITEDLLAKGAGHMNTVAETLSQVAHNYVVAEADATGEAAKLERMLNE